MYLVRETSQHQVKYPLGCSRRWLEMLLLLVFPFLVVYIVLFIVVHRVGGSFPHDLGVAFLLMIPAWFALFLSALYDSSDRWRFFWLSDISDNLAYGSAGEDGIHFRKWFRRRFIDWKGIEQLEYWPDRGGRIDLHLFSQRSSVVFMPELPLRQIAQKTSASLDTVDYIARSLERTWPGRSTFLICFEKPDSKEQTFIEQQLLRLSVRERAFVYALCVLLISAFW